MAASSTQLELPEEDNGSVTTIEYIGKEVDLETVGKRKEVNLQTHLLRYEYLIQLVTSELEKKRRKSEMGTRLYSKMVKHLKEMQKELPRVIASTKRTRKVTNSTCGFSMGYHISPELAKFLGVGENELFSRADISKAFYVYIHLSPDEDRAKLLRWKHLNPDGKRNLQDPTNKTRILPDKALSRILGYEAYKKDVADGKIQTSTKDKMTKEKIYTVQTDDGLYYSTIQKLITKHMIKVETPQ